MAAGDPMPDGIGVETMVEAGDWPEETEIAAGNVAAVRAAVRRARPDLAEGAEVAIILSDDDHLRELNRRGGGLALCTACAAGGLGAAMVLEAA